MTDWQFERIFMGSLAALIVLTPLLFGSVHPWAYGLISSAGFFLLAFKLLSARAQGRFSYVRTSLHIFLPLSICFFLIQVTPLPIELAKIISPGLPAIRKAAGLSQGTATLALYPWAMKGQAVLLASVLVIFFLVINTVRTKQQVSLLVSAAALSGVVLVFLALAQRAAAGRPSFLPFINKNHFAGYMELLAPMMAALCYVNYSGVRAASGIKDIFLETATKRNAAMVLLHGLAGVLFFCSIIMTYSRGGLFGMVFSFFVLFALLAGKKRRWLSLAAVAVMLVLSVALINADDGKVLSHIEDLAKDDVSALIRYEVWHDTAGMIRRFPWAGVGLGCFETAFPSYKTIDMDANFYQPESDYLYILAEAGFAGLILAMAFLCIFLWKVLSAHAARDDRFAKGIAAGCIAGLSALLLHGLVDTSLHMPSIMLLAAIFMGIAYAATGTRFRRSGNGERKWLPEREVVLGRKGRMVMALCAVFSFFVSGMALAGSASDLLYRSALNDKKALAQMRDARPSDYYGIIRKLQVASLLDPGRAEYSFEEGRAYLWLADYAAIIEKIGVSRPGLETSRTYNEKALGRFREASLDNPYSSFPHLLAGRVLRRLPGDSGAVEKEFEAAGALNPTSPATKRLADYRGDSNLPGKYQAEKF